MGQCRHCGKDLLPENAMMADGCPCNSGRGINHGLVDPATCTCNLCDPDRTGGSRFRMPIIKSMVELEDGTFVVEGTCVCGLGANMRHVQPIGEGFVPRCLMCSRNLVSAVPITREIFDMISIQHVMTS